MPRQDGLGALDAEVNCEKRYLRLQKKKFACLQRVTKLEIKRTSGCEVVVVGSRLRPMLQSGGECRTVEDQ
jgi:hypothetical protein